jgi:hypothetical protein
MSQSVVRMRMKTGVYISHKGIQSRGGLIALPTLPIPIKKGMMTIM